jgi:hypothetical protein
MFQASANRLRTFMRWAVDVLGDPEDDALAPHHNFISHPHRRPLRWERDRRPGTVAARPAHCISPVRASRGGTRRDPAVR